MAIVDVKETWDGREGGIEVTGRMTSRRTFRVITDNPRTGWVDIVSHPDIPILGTVHPENFSLYCAGVNPRQVNKKLWEVAADYTNETGRAEQPEDDVAQIEWDTEQFQKPAVQDINGSAILNSAGDEFDDPAEMDDSRRVVTIRKNLLVVPTWILDYQDTVNDAQFTVDGFTVSAEKAKIQRISVGPEQIRNNTTFRQVTITMHLRRDGWNLFILNRGWRYVSSTVRIPIYYDDAGNLVDSTHPQAQRPAVPVLLSAAGTVISNPSVSNAIFREFQVYETRDFSVLPLS